MPTSNFSIPETLQLKFNELFRGRNKSQIIAALMQRAIDEESLNKQRQKAIKALLKRRASRKSVSERLVHEARVAGRP